MTTSKEQKAKRKRGRPVTLTMPESIPDTPENVAKALLSTPRKREDEWEYARRSEATGE